MLLLCSSHHGHNTQQIRWLEVHCISLQFRNQQSATRNNTTTRVNRMAACCIGGICIPYSAILPLILIILQYLAKPLHNAGLLPDVIAKRIGLVNATNVQEAVLEEEEEDKKRKRRSKGCKTECCTNAKENDPQEVVMIESMEEYTEAVKNNDTVIVKMTAEWCKPCKVIHSYFAGQLASQYSNGRTKFVIVDVDAMDEIATEFSVSILPSFVAVKNGTVEGKYTGSDEKKLEEFVKKSCFV